MRSSSALLGVLLFLAVGVVAQTPLATNLLTNPGFEMSATSWTTLSGSVSIQPYGPTPNPSSFFANQVGLGGFFMRDSGNGNAVVEQIVAIAGLPANAIVHAGGFFGGFSAADDSRLVIRFLNSSGSQIQQANLAYVTESNRNSESVLLYRDARLPIPPGTASIAARIEFRDVNCCPTNAAADGIFVEILTTPLIPAPLPINTELLVNGEFESGWIGGSPLTLTSGGWEGIGGRSVVKAYSNNDPSVCGTIVSCVIGGGFSPFTNCIPGGAGNLLSDNGGGALRQRLDVRGNAAMFAAFGTVALRVSAYLGGTGTPDTARVDVRFLDGTGTVLGALPSLGPVSQNNRNFETVLVRRSNDYLILPATQFIEIDIVFADNNCCTTEGLIDKVSAMIVPFTTPAPVPLNINLISNGGFEVGDLPFSPLELNNQLGWTGVAGGRVDVPSYGSSPFVPPTSFSALNGLGGLLARGGNGTLRQVIDLTGSTAAVNSGSYTCFAEAWLGGNGSDADSAELRIRFENLAGVQVGGAGGLQILGPVTPAQRGNATTLLRRSATFPVPPGAARIVVDLQFNPGNCCMDTGYADGISVVVFGNVTGGPVPYPGTNEDFRLYTGINAAPTTGPGNVVKTAVANDVLNMRAQCPNGTFDFAPLFLIGHAISTGTPPPAPIGMLAQGLAFNPFAPASFVIFDGYACGVFACPVALPGGTLFNFMIPPGVSGTSLYLQAAVAPLPGAPNLPNNGIFAASEAHEIRIL